MTDEGRLCRRSFDLDAEACEATSGRWIEIRKDLAGSSSSAMHSSGLGGAGFLEETLRETRAYGVGEKESLVSVTRNL